jgi:uncharacterized membrane protein SpoIIM required for sporulation
MGHQIPAGYIKKLYLSSFKDVRKAGNTILITVALFLICISIGMVHPTLSDDTLSSMKNLAKYLSGKSITVLVLTIFLKNSLSTMLSVLTGPFLGIIPISGAIINGLLLGSTLTYIKEINQPYALIYLFPHGLFEFPAMFMAWGLGLWQGIWFFEKQRDDSFKERRNKALRILFIIILPLLFVAAMIEGTSIYARI